MKRLILLISLLVLGITTNANAYSDEWSKILYNSVRYHENGNDVIVDIESIKNSLRNGANPNYINSDNKYFQTVLSHYVSIIGLSERDSDVVSQGCKALNILFNAGAKLGKDESGILFFPIAYGQTCTVEVLLNNGASATHWDKNKIGTALTPIETAEAYGYKEIADLLIKYGATPISSETILQLRLVQITKIGSLMQLQEIIRKGAQVNTADSGNQTALISAASTLFIRVPEDCAKVFYLIDQGADINLAGEGDYGETTPLHALIYYSSFKLKSGKDTSCVKQLIDYFIDKGAYVSRQDNIGSTPLHIAAKYNNLYAANKLLSAGCKIMTKDFKGKTPLDLAVSKEMIKLLKKYGAKER